MSAPFTSDVEAPAETSMAGAVPLTSIDCAIAPSTSSVTPFASSSVAK